MNANRTFAAALGFAALLLPVSAQQNLESAYRTTGQAVVAAFESQRQVLQVSSAVILDGRKEIGYGVVISPDGYILTKASEVTAVTNPAVTVDQTKYAEAKVVLVDPEWDVALLKVEATGLVPVVYAPTSEVPQGTWVVANGVTSRTNRRALAGIISAKPREIPAAGGAALGIAINPDGKSVEISEINEKGGAKEAGLKPGDVILSIGGKKIGKFGEVGESLKGHKAGTTVKITYRRGKEELTADVRLSTRGELNTEEKTRNDEMSGEFSARRSGFPRVIQTDLLGNRFVQGGPLLDLDGRCLGMNIARADRSESFSIPVEDLRELAVKMMKQVGSTGASGN